MTKLGSKVVCITFALCLLPVAVQAQTFTLLTTFDFYQGAEPLGLAQGSDGSFYGITFGGGAGDGGFGDGTAFGVTPAGLFSSLYNFCSLANCIDGGEPSGSLMLSTDGYFYGSARYGGLHMGGILFKAKVNGISRALYNFCSQPNCSDGAYPYSGLNEAANGDLYGTTYSGGRVNQLCGLVGCGTIFKIDSKGKLTKIHDFCMQTNCADGSLPEGGLVQASDGYLYGTTTSGGSSGFGTVFRLSTAGKTDTLYNFCSLPSCVDGATPASGLIEGTDGNLYGTTMGGGDMQCFPGAGCGTVFQITLYGAFTTLHTFEGTDGIFPSGLIQATDGTFYGTTEQGGSIIGAGTIFRVSSAGVLTTLYNFCASDFECDDGSNPEAGVIQATNGIFYGSAGSGGSLGVGTLYSLNTGLVPFVALVRPFGKVGETGGILGQGMTGTTAVAVNGIEADFKVVSDTYLTATIPAGATTGYVTVTTPTSVLTSNVPFRVIQ